MAGSATSAAAADSVEKGRAKASRRVREYIGAQGDLGATDDEVERALGMRHQTASARRRELYLTGAVIDSGLRRATSSGRLATVWVAS